MRQALKDDIDYITSNNSWNSIYFVIYTGQSHILTRILVHNFGNNEVILRKIPTDLIYLVYGENSDIMKNARSVQ